MSSNNRNNNRYSFWEIPYQLACERNYQGCNKHSNVITNHDIFRLCKATLTKLLINMLIWKTIETHKSKFTLLNVT